LESSTISISEVKQQEKDQAETGRIDREIDFERDLVALQSRIPDMRQFANSKRLLSPNSSRALDKVERLDPNITRPEKNALKYLFSQMKEKGSEFSVDWDIFCILDSDNENQPKSLNQLEMNLGDAVPSSVPFSRLRWRNKDRAARHRLLVFDTASCLAPALSIKPFFNLQLWHPLKQLYPVCVCRPTEWEF